MAHDVFISHEKNDRQIAEIICSTIEKYSIKCWIAPRDVQGNYGEQIINAINSSTIMVLVLSKNANDSNFVYREVERAVSKRKTIYTLRIEDVPPSKKLELYISCDQWFDMFGSQTSESVNNLINRIKFVLPPSPETDQKITPRHMALTYNCWRKEGDDRFKQWDKEFNNYVYRVDFSIVAKGDVRSKIQFVQYVLHPSWKAFGSSSEQKSDNDASNFQLKELIWGNFLLYAEVHLKNQDIVPLSCFVQIPKVKNSFPKEK
jgi:hypothetical protein